MSSWDKPSQGCSYINKDIASCCYSCITKISSCSNKIYHRIVQKLFVLFASLCLKSEQHSFAANWLPHCPEAYSLCDSHSECAHSILWNFSSRESKAMTVTCCALSILTGLHIGFFWWHRTVSLRFQALCDIFDHYRCFILTGCGVACNLVWKHHM